MKFGPVFESIDEAITKPLTREGEIALLERKKRAMLHELKIVSIQMHDWISAGVVSQMGDADKHPDAPKIPDSETRRVLTKDPTLQQRVFRTFARFNTAKEILSNSIMPELEALQKTAEEKK